MSAITCITVHADTTEEAEDAAAHALVSWLAGWRVLHHPDETDETCEQVLAWLQR